MADVTELTLFSAAIVEMPDAPRCKMCSRPAWRRSTGVYHAYCSSGGCTNRERICQACGRPFHLNLDGAGTKYCSTECKQEGYTVGLRREPQSHACAWCGRSSSGIRVARNAVWPYICNKCVDPIRHLLHRLKSHKVPHGMAQRLLDNPGCEVCGRDIVTKVRDSSTGKLSAPLVVDHDHRCCPDMRSCGLCVRGLLCAHCNWAAGSIGDDPERARALARYLDRFGG